MRNYRLRLCGYDRKSRKAGTMEFPPRAVKPIETVAAQ
jgi:hypothetical protein